MEQRECPVCKYQLAEGENFCAHCGARITVCPECGSIFAGEIAVCTHCGYRLKEAEAPAREAPVDEKAADEEEKDMQTLLKEYMAYDTDLKSRLKLINVLGIIFFLPLIMITLFLVMAYVSCVRSTGSLWGAGAAMWSVLKSSEGLFDAGWNFTGVALNVNGNTAQLVASIVNFLVYFLTLLFALNPIAEGLKRHAILSKLAAAPYDLGKTVARLKKEYENEQAGITNIEETQLNAQPWEYVLRTQGGQEAFSNAVAIILNALMTLFPFLYAIVYSIAFFFGASIPGIFALAAVILLLVIRLIISSIMGKARNKRKRAFLEKYESNPNSKPL